MTGRELRPVPKIGERWRHFKGNEYTIVRIALMEANHTVHIVYEPADHAGEAWIRPVMDFMAPVGDGWRFERV